MNKKNEEFFVPYIEGSLGPKTKATLKTFFIIIAIIIVVGAILFSFFQNPFKNSTFELTSTTQITGTYHETPYPMLRAEIANNTYKNILLLGFGKSSANPYLEELKSKVKNLNGKAIQIEGNLIYYNGKTLLQITDKEKVTLVGNSNINLPNIETLGIMELEGEIVDPKCFFGVMKPGKGKIHRSCAVRCISGGIPPVLTINGLMDDEEQYYLVTNEEGEPINNEILPYVGKPSKIKGMVQTMNDWYIIKIKVSDIVELNRDSSIY